MTELNFSARTMAPGGRPSRSIGASLGVIVAAFLVVMVAGQNVGLGPLDLATADRLAFGLWVLGPLIGGVLDRRASNVGLARAALTLGTIVGACVTLFFLAASGTGNYVCSVSLAPLPRAIGTLLVGGLAGGGIGMGFYVSGWSARRPIAVVPGLVVAGVVVLATSLGAMGLFYEAVRCLG